MWFKQIKLFQLSKTFHCTPEDLEQKLESLKFRPCLSTLPFSAGWVSPIHEEDMPLVQPLNNRFMLCLQIEEKVLPAAIIRQTLESKVKEKEKLEDRKMRAKTKQALKEEIIHTLLPKAFSKFSRLYAYIDLQNHWLVIGTANEKRTQHFLEVFKKSLTQDTCAIDNKKLASLLTRWLKHQNHPSSFSIGKICKLQDAQQKNRNIRCQQQNLFASSIQSLINDGCEAKQLALEWEDKVNFILSADTFSLSGLQYQDTLISQSKEMELETALQQFNADFLIMTETLTGLFHALLAAVGIGNTEEHVQSMERTG